jgi:hypothetical protein
MEEPLTTIQPWQGVTGAVELRELHLVTSDVVVMAGVPCISIPSAPSGTWWRAVIARRALLGLDAFDCVAWLLVVLILVGHCRLQCINTHLQRLQRFQLQLDVVDAAHDRIEPSLEAIPRIGSGLRTHGAGERTWLSGYQVVIGHGSREIGRNGMSQLILERGNRQRPKASASLLCHCGGATLE